jgi:hypothetical protein
VSGGGGMLAWQYDEFFKSVQWCIDARRPHAICVPWVTDSKASIAAATAELLARGWVYNAAEKQWECGGWFLWLRSQGNCGSPIAQFNRIAPWGDEVDGWGLRHTEFIDASLSCPDCGDYSEHGICEECRAKQKPVSNQLTLF